MPRKPRSQMDPFEHEIELTFNAGAFFPDGMKTMNDGFWLSSCSANLTRRFQMRVPAAVISRRCFPGPTDRNQGRALWKPNAHGYQQQEIGQSKVLGADERNCSGDSECIAASLSHVSLSSCSFV